MNTAVFVPVKAAMRWMLVVAGILLIIALISVVMGGRETAGGVLETVCILVVAMGIYSWMVSPRGVGTFISGLILLGIGWAWAVRQETEVGVIFGAFGVLLSAAFMQRRRRFRRLFQMNQLLDDAEEEHTVKNQAIGLAEQTHESLEKKHARYQHLRTIAEELSNLTELGKIGQLAVDSTFDLIGKSDVCLLFLVDKERQELSLFASRKHANIASVRAKHGDQFDRYVLRTHRPLLVNDVRRDFRFTMSGSQTRQINSVIAAPVLHNQSAEGVLRLDSAEPGIYTQDDLRFLDILLDLVAIAITNSRLFTRTQLLAMTDGLTNLLLRRPFLDQLTHELTRAGRSREMTSVLMLDLDEFKAYNDTFGHTAGDVVLTTVSKILQKVVPPEGIIGRYGGEEFSVLLPRTVRKDAHDIGEQIRASVERSLRKPRRTGQSPVTISVGVATFPEDAQAEFELIRVADQRLYEAKRLGRNRVCS